MYTAAFIQYSKRILKNLGINWDFILRKIKQNDHQHSYTSIVAFFNGSLDLDDNINWLVSGTKQVFYLILRLIVMIKANLRVKTSVNACNVIMIVYYSIKIRRHNWRNIE